MIENSHDDELKLELLAKLVRRRLESAPGCHDWDHTRRVFRNARAIMAETEQVGDNQFDTLVVECAAILHDVARPEELRSNGKICHAALGAKLAPEILAKCGFHDVEFSAKVADCVITHRYRGSDANKPETMEQRILFDADKLDSIGAVGVARALHFSGRIGSSLHNSEKEALASNSYGTGDSAYREYLVKLRHIPQKMLTEVGENLAVERGEFTSAFFNRLNDECGSDDPHGGFDPVGCA